MLTIGPQVKVFLAAQPVDMRKSFDSLAALVDETLQLDPLSGHLFVFRSRRGDRLKILYWDEHRGRFHSRWLERPRWNCNRSKCRKDLLDGAKRSAEDS